MQTFDKEIELKKLEIVKESFQSSQELANSIMSTAMIALLVVVVTLGVSHTQYLTESFIGILIITIVFALGFYLVHTRNKYALSHYDRWMIDI